MHMRKFTLSIAVLMTLMSGTNLLAQSLKYPETRTEESQTVYQGVAYTDPYSWLDNHDREEVQAWTRSQDDLFRSYVGESHLEADVHSKVRNLMKIKGRMELPSMSDDYLFYLLNDSARQWRLLKQPIAGGESKTLNIPFHPRRVFFYIPNRNGKYLALGVAAGAGNFDWRFFDTEENLMLPDTLVGTQLGRTRLAWDKQGIGVYYVGSQMNEDGKRSNLSIKHHQIGQDGEDRVLYKAKSPGSKLELNTCKGVENLIVSERIGAATGCELFYIDLANGEKSVLYSGGESSFIFLGNRLHEFFFETDLDASRGRIVSVNIKDPNKNWKEVIPESALVILGYQSAGGTLLPVMTDNRIVVPYQEELKLSLKSFDFNGKATAETSIPSGGLYFSTNGSNAMSASAYTDQVLLRFIGITEPNAIYAMDARNGDLKPLLKAQTYFDPTTYKSEIVFATSQDGTKVPITLTYKKRLKRNGKNYLMMQVYGAVAFTNYPYFQGDFIGWLEMGGIHAVAHIRGGGAKGDQWHKAGIARNKQNGIDDFKASLQWVIDNRWTKARNIVINGVSAGTIPVASLLLQQPKLIGAAVLHYGMIDMLGYASKFADDQNYAYMLPEIGNPANEGDFEAIRKYSPYQNVESGEKYPPVLLLTSENDAPLNSETYKMTARLQNLEGSSGPFLMQMAWGSSHSTFGSQTQHPAKTFADELLFLIRAMDIEVTEDFEFVQR